MAVQTPQKSTAQSEYMSAESEYTGYYEADERGSGWVTFAGVLLLMLATINVIEGIAAIDNANFFVANTHYVISDLNTWGWVVLGVGVVQGLAGFGVFLKNQFARWLGVFILGCNALAQMLMMPAYPFWSLSILALDVLAMFGLVAYGKRIAGN